MEPDGVGDTTMNTSKIAEATSASELLFELHCLCPEAEAAIPREVWRALQHRIEAAMRAERALAQLCNQAEAAKAVLQRSNPAT